MNLSDILTDTTLTHRRSRPTTLADRAMVPDSFLQKVEFNMDKASFSDTLGMFLEEEITGSLYLEGARQIFQQNRELLTPEFFQDYMICYGKNWGVNYRGGFQDCLSLDQAAKEKSDYARPSVTRESVVYELAAYHRQRNSVLLACLMTEVNPDLLPSLATEERMSLIGHFILDNRTITVLEEPPSHTHLLETTFKNALTCYKESRGVEEALLFQRRFEDEEAWWMRKTPFASNNPDTSCVPGPEHVCG
ncbi:MAG: hypothetical protein H6857_05230 [Rhodospirillales bacterium]|nr:hypothetical protein [Rhodospirillales bacterium]